jgi:DNA-binding NtrC family response regulator
MAHMNVVIIQSDPQHAQSLAALLGSRSCNVSVAGTVDELRRVVKKHGVQSVVVDLDVVSMKDVTALTREFGLEVICTHRIPDDKMWVDAMNAGAVDVCCSTDATAISGALCLNHHSAAA